MPSTFTGVNVAARFDISTWEATSIPTPDAYNYLRCRTPVGRFRIDTVTGDAFRYGFNVKSGKVPRWVMPIFKQCVKYSDTFGYAAMHHVDAMTIDALPPLFNTSRGGIGTIEEDDLGQPKVFNYQKTASDKPTPIDPKDVTLFSAMSADRCYAGHSCFEPVIDDLMYLQKWRMASGTRAREYANAGKIAVKVGDWSPEEKAQISRVFPRAKIVTVSVHQAGEFELLDVGGLLTESELGLTTESIKEMIAAGFGVTKSDITGSSAGQKLGDDFNQSSYFMTLEDEQHNYAECAYEMFEKLQVDVVLDDEFPFKPPREIQLAERVQTLNDIALAYLSLSSQGKPQVDRTGNATPGDPAAATAGKQMAAVMQQLFFKQAKFL